MSRPRLSARLLWLLTSAFAAGVVTAGAALSSMQISESLGLSLLVLGVVSIGVVRSLRIMATLSGQLAEDTGHVEWRQALVISATSGMAMLLFLGLLAGSAWTLATGLLSLIGGVVAGVLVTRPVVLWRT